MIYILSFFRRLQLKSAFYFSGLPALVLFFTTFDIMATISLWAILTVFLLFIAHLINLYDRKKITNIECVICGFHHCSLLYPAKRKSKSQTKGDFACSSFDHGQYSNIFYCPSCKNGFLQEIVDKTYNISSDFELYESVIDEKYIENLEARYLTNKKLVEKNIADLKGKDVLEIGCYYGAFLHEVKKVANSYCGIEPSKHACDYVKSNYKDVEIFQGSLDSFCKKNPQRQFDTIVLWDVIEHVPNPVEVLRSINSLLKTGGRVIFSTINIESTFSLALGPYWPWYMDMHYYYFSDRGYVDILHRSGFFLDKHSHFSYYVKATYFTEKITSILFGRPLIPNFARKIFDFPLKIKFGDTVMISGTKISSESAL